MPANALKHQKANPADAPPDLPERQDSTPDPDAERAWLDEARRRYQAWRAGDLDSIAGPEAIQTARERLAWPGIGCRRRLRQK